VSCPSSPPAAGSACAGEEGLVCSYGDGTCGGEECTCEGGEWSCGIGGCPPPPPPVEVCPTFPPEDGSACNSTGDNCTYYVNGDCNQESCECLGSGSWSCAFAVECGEDDAGVPGNP